MTDPLSITASVTAVATVTTQIISTLTELRALKNLPRRLHAINNEVTDLEVVLYQLESLVADRKSLHTLATQDRLPHVLHRADTELQELSSTVQQLLQSCVGSSKFFIRAKTWAFEKPKIQEI